MNITNMQKVFKRLEAAQKRLNELEQTEKVIRLQKNSFSIQYYVDHEGWKNIPVVGDEREPVHNQGVRRGMDMVHLGLLKWCAGEITAIQAHINELNGQLLDCM